MSTLREIVKDRKVYSIDAARTVLEAARFMMENNVGALPVLRNGELAGIFSERDIMNRVVAAGRQPGYTAVSEVMTANPRAVHLDERVRFSAPVHRGRQRSAGTGLPARHSHAPGRRTAAADPACRLVRAGFTLFCATGVLLLSAAA